jgi:hypothetical protein
MVVRTIQSLVSVLVAHGFHHALVRMTHTHATVRTSQEIAWVHMVLSVLVPLRVQASTTLRTATTNLVVHSQQRLQSRCQSLPTLPGVITTFLTTLLLAQTL